MLVGVPKEIKNHEYRVGLTPGSVRELTRRGHEVMVQKNAGHKIDLKDSDYQAVGAKIIDTPEEIFAKADMIVKVKEPQLNECEMLREGQILYTYLHLAPDPAQTQGLIKSGCIAIALAVNEPDLVITGVDISSLALSVARQNALNNAVNVSWLQADYTSNEQSWRH